MTTLHNGARALSAPSVRSALVVTLGLVAAYGLGVWGSDELLHFEPYTVELNLLVPRLDVARFTRLLGVLQLVVGVVLVATLLLRRLRERR